MSALKLHSSSTIDIYSASVDSNIEIPFISSDISAGFPSPALDFVDISIDLNKHLIKRPSSTFYGRVKGESMKDAGINDGDLLVIDKSLEPVDGKIAICFIDGEFTLKRIHITNEGIELQPANEKFKTIKITPEMDFIIWGIVIHVIKTL
jgi:DNA polymerase V